MDENRLTVYFEDPFWVGVFERRTGGTVSACKVTFGAEPRDREVLSFVLREYDRLEFGPGVKDCGRTVTPTYAKLKKLARREVERKGVGTKSQQALQAQRELQAVERKQRSRQRREAEKDRLYEMKRQKRREKHRGR